MSPERGSMTLTDFTKSAKNFNDLARFTRCWPPAVSRQRPRCGPSGLLEFDQGAAEVLRVQEQHRLAVGADPGFAVAQDPGAARS